MMDEELKKEILKKIMAEMDSMEGEKLKKPKAMEVSIEAKALSPDEAKDKLKEALEPHMESGPTGLEDGEDDGEEDEESYGDSELMKKLMAMKKAKKAKMG